MKPFIILLLSLLLLSCASRRDGCGTERYRKSFRVEKIQRDRTGQYIVTLRSEWQEKRYLVCCQLADSVRVGRMITL